MNIYEKKITNLKYDQIGIKSSEFYFWYLFTRFPHKRESLRSRWPIVCIVFKLNETRIISNRMEYYYRNLLVYKNAIAWGILIPYERTEREAKRVIKISKKTCF